MAGDEIPPKEEEYIPKRGDLVRFTGGDEIIGIVAGWIDKETLCIVSLPDQKIVAFYFNEDVELLAKIEELKNPDFPPWKVVLEANRPH